MNKLKSIIISMLFYPIEGGIETYLLETAKYWDYHNIEAWCKKQDNIPILIDSPIIIKRFSWDQGSYAKTFKIIINHIYICNHIFSLLLYTFLLIINRNAIRYCISFIEESLTSFKGKNTKKTIIQCSMPIFTGVIGCFYKLVYGSKLIVYVHGSELILYDRKVNQRLLQKFVLKQADLIISNSNYTTQLAISKGADPKKIYKTLLGANTKMFFPKDTNKEIKSKYGIPDNHLILLTVSHLVPRKGNDMVIKSLPAIIKEIPNLTYIIGGRGEYNEVLHKLVSELKLESHVKFIGFVPDEEINDLFNACDIFIMPNRQEDYDVEGFGIVFADAAACAKPTIAGNSGGAVDAIVDNHTGFLVDPLSIDDIAEKCIKLLKDTQLRQQFGQNGYDRVQSELNWDIVTKKIYNKIHEIANEKN